MNLQQNLRQKPVITISVIILIYVLFFAAIIAALELFSDHRTEAGVFVLTLFSVWSTWTGVNITSYMQHLMSSKSNRRR